MLYVDYISIGLGKRITVMTEIIHILTKCLASNKHSVMLIIDLFLLMNNLYLMKYTNLL